MLGRKRRARRDALKAAGIASEGAPGFTIDPDGSYRDSSGATEDEMESDIQGALIWDNRDLDDES